MNKGTFYLQDDVEDLLDDDEVQVAKDLGMEYDAELGLFVDEHGFVLNSEDVVARVRAAQYDLDTTTIDLGAGDPDAKVVLGGLEVLELTGDGEVDIDGDDAGTTVGLRTYGLEGLVLTAVNRGVSLDDVSPVGPEAQPRPRKAKDNRKVSKAKGSTQRPRKATAPKVPLEVLRTAHAEGMARVAGRGAESLIRTEPCTVVVAGHRVPGTRYYHRLVGVVLPPVEVPNLPERPRSQSQYRGKGPRYSKGKATKR